VRPPPDAPPPRRREGGADRQLLDDKEPTQQGNAASRWLEDEISSVIEVLTAARLSANAGHVPVVHLRRAAVRLAALDAAVADDLEIVRNMRAEVES
jgi:hypothetical protein